MTVDPEREWGSEQFRTLWGDGGFTPVERPHPHARLAMAAALLTYPTLLLAIVLAPFVVVSVAMFVTSWYALVRVRLSARTREMPPATLGLARAAFWVLMPFTFLFVVYVGLWAFLPTL